MENIPTESEVSRDGDNPNSDLPQAALNQVPNPDGPGFLMPSGQFPHPGGDGNLTPVGENVNQRNIENTPQPQQEALIDGETIEPVPDEEPITGEATLEVHGDQDTPSN